MNNSETPNQLLNLFENFLNKVKLIKQNIHLIKSEDFKEKYPNIFQLTNELMTHTYTINTNYNSYDIDKYHITFKDDEVRINKVQYKLENNELKVNQDNGDRIHIIKYDNYKKIIIKISKINYLDELSKIDYLDELYKSVK